MAVALAEDAGDAQTDRLELGPVRGEDQGLRDGFDLGVGIRVGGLGPDLGLGLREFLARLLHDLVGGSVDEGLDRGRLHRAPKHILHALDDHLPQHRLSGRPAGIREVEDDARLDVEDLSAETVQVRNVLRVVFDIGPAVLRRATTEHVDGRRPVGLLAQFANNVGSDEATASDYEVGTERLGAAGRSLREQRWGGGASEPPGPPKSCHRSWKA